MAAVTTCVDESLENRVVNINIQSTNDVKDTDNKDTDTAETANKNNIIDKTCNKDNDTARKAKHLERANYLEKIQEQLPETYLAIWDAAEKSPLRLKVKENLEKKELIDMIEKWTHNLAEAMNSKPVQNEKYVRINCTVDESTMHTSIFGSGTIMIQSTDQSYNDDHTISERVTEALKLLREDKSRKQVIKINQLELSAANKSIQILGSCIICDDIDSDEMIQCELCQSWIHYQCDSIDTETVEETKYTCPPCKFTEIKQTPKPTTRSRGGNQKKVEKKEVPTHELKTHRLQHRNKQEAIVEYIKLNANNEETIKENKTLREKCEEYRVKIDEKTEAIAIMEETAKNARERCQNNPEKDLLDAQESVLNLKIKLQAQDKKLEETRRNNTGKQNEIKKLKVSISMQEKQIGDLMAQRELRTFHKIKLEESLDMRNQMYESLQVIANENHKSLTDMTQRCEALETELNAIAISRINEMDVRSQIGYSEDDQEEETDHTEDYQERSILEDPQERRDRSRDEERGRPPKQYERRQDKEDESRRRNRQRRGERQSDRNQPSKDDSHQSNNERVRREPEPPKQPPVDRNSDRRDRPQKRNERRSISRQNERRHEERGRTRHQSVKRDDQRNPGNYRNYIVTNSTFRKTTECRYFLQGYCKHGDSCNFKHTDQAREPTRSATRCRFYDEGRCKFGERCDFSHEGPPRNINERQQRYTSDRQQRNVNEREQRPTIMRSSEHQEREGNRSTQTESRNTRKSEREPRRIEKRCTDFDKGYCRHGRRCTLKHMKNRIEEENRY